MQIPNYDRKEESTDFKQQYGFMPENVFRILLCGASGCGKANLLMHMLMKPLISYDKIYLYSKQLEQDKYQNLIKTLSEISKEVVYPVIEYSNEDIIPVKDLPTANEQQTVVIFDDYVCEKNQSIHSG